MEEKEKKLVITPLERSKEINQALANDTCRAILDAVSDEPMSASQISEKLNLPLTTADYNIKKLLGVDLISVHHKRWSPKGKKVNFYGPKEKYVVIGPGLKSEEVIENLKKLLPAFVGAAVVSGFVEWITRPKYFGAAVQETALKAPEGITGPTTGIVVPTPHYGLWLFVVSVVGISIYTLYKSYGGGNE